MTPEEHVKDIAFHFFVDKNPYFHSHQYLKDLAEIIVTQGLQHISKQLDNMELAVRRTDSQHRHPSKDR